MAITNQQDNLDEVVIELRNANIISTTIRGVTTATATGNLIAKDEIEINVSNVKNVRSVTIGSTLLNKNLYSVVYGDKCIITLNEDKTDTYSVSYDYGTDKIFSGYPRDDISINSFPRIAVEYIDIVSDAGGFGNVNRNKHDISIIVYAPTKQQVRDIIHNIRSWCITNQNNLINLKLIKPVMIGPLVPASEFVKFKDKIFKQNFDFAGLLQYEVN